jgi:hypothetical protein
LCDGGDGGARSTGRGGRNGGRGVEREVGVAEGGRKARARPQPPGL